MLFSRFDAALRAFTQVAAILCASQAIDPAIVKEYSRSRRLPAAGQTGTYRRPSAGAAIWRTSALLGLAMLAGCQALQPKRSEPIESEVEIRPTWTVTADQAQVRQGWLKDFSDPTLDALVLEALTSNYDLRAAAMRVEQERARARIVGAELFPRVDAGASASRRAG
jgi:hypothetical protein